MGMALPWREVAIDGGHAVGTSETEAEAAKLRELAAGARVLEVGSAFGFSAITMVAGGAKHVFAVDPHGGRLHGAPAIVDSLGGMRRHLELYGADGKVTICLSPSQVVLPAFFDAGMRFDLVFIDGDHQHDAVVNDVTWGAELLREGGTLACHDYGELTCPDVRPVLDGFYPDGPDELVDTLWVKRDA